MAKYSIKENQTDVETRYLGVKGITPHNWIYYCDGESETPKIAPKTIKEFSSRQLAQEEFEEYKTNWDFISSPIPGSSYYSIKYYTLEKERNQYWENGLFLRFIDISRVPDEYFYQFYKEETILQLENIINDCEKKQLNKKGKKIKNLKNEPIEYIVDTFGTSKNCFEFFINKGGEFEDCTKQFKEILNFEINPSQNEYGGLLVKFIIQLT